MAAQDLMDALIAALGTAQPERDDSRLRPDSAPLDDRDTAELLRSLQALAALIRHHARLPTDPPTEPPGNWLPYMPSGNAAQLAALVQRGDGQVPPHHGLLIAFLRLLARPQARLNDFTAQHLQYQVQQVLGFRPTAPQPDRAHLVLELKKNTAPIELGPEHAFSAGKDATKVEMLYRPVRTSVVGPARVARLASVRRQGQRLLFAPQADSADGLGAPLDPAAPHWPPFGHAGLPAAPVGFGLASPLLRLAEGDRLVQLKLRLPGLPAGLSAAALAASFDAYLSGPKGWIGPLAISGSLSGELLTLGVHLDASREPVVDHDPAIHQHAFPAALPVIQCLLKADAPLAYAALQGLVLGRAQIVVQASGLRQLVLDNDEATLDPKKACLPFGSQPVIGSRLHIACAEALAKPLTSLKLHLVWQGAPPDLYDWYAGYTQRNKMLDGVGASLGWRDLSGNAHATGSVTLLPRFAAATTLDLVTGSSAAAHGPASRSAALHFGGSAVALRRAGEISLALPVVRIAPALARLGAARFAGVGATPRAGVITLTLLEDLLHGSFAADATRAATPPMPLPANTSFTPQILNPPYTPKLQELTLDYAAESDDSRIADPSQAAFTDTAVQFFQVDALGLAREHAWLSAARPWAAQGGITLLPAHAAAGELLLGLEGAQAGAALSLLFQVAEGSADPLAAAQTLQWSVLADNAWRPLTPGELTLDTTRSLRASGIVACVLPRETSTADTRLPGGLVWLRASIPAEPGAACELHTVQANAIEVVFSDQGNDPQRLARPLGAGSIAKLKIPVNSVKSVRQPGESFGGALQEGSAALSRRSAERLRHRNRAITGWDIERLVLQAFASVYRAKCIPHASETSWLAGGHLMVVVIPDLRHRPSRDPLQPRVDLDTLQRIREYLSQRCGPQTRVHVRNPVYRAVQLDFKLRLRPGHGFDFHGPRTSQALQRALSPWAFDADPASHRGLGFGGRVVRSELLDFVESLPWVDFVTDFRLGIEGSSGDHDELSPDAPDAILVSAERHRITELVDAGAVGA